MCIDRGDRLTDRFRCFKCGWRTRTSLWRIFSEDLTNKNIHNYNPLNASFPTGFLFQFPFQDKPFFLSCCGSYHELFLFEQNTLHLFVTFLLICSWQNSSVLEQIMNEWQSHKKEWDVSFRIYRISCWIKVHVFDCISRCCQNDTKHAHLF